MSDDPTSTGFQRPGAAPYKHTTHAFALHLDRIAAGPCTPELVTDMDLLRPGHHLLLTFDDGGKSALYVGEELCERGWRGHFFITTSLIGMRTFLTADEIREIRRCGHLIGSHSHTHPDIFREQPMSRMVAEWSVSCDVLSNILGEPCTVASVPGGDISRAVLLSAPAAGVRYLFTSEPSLSPRRVGGAWVLGRFAPKIEISPARIGELVRFRGWMRAMMVRRAKVLVRRSLPKLYRLYVKHRISERDGQSLPIEW